MSYVLESLLKHENGTSTICHQSVKESVTIGVNYDDELLFSKMDLFDFLISIRRKWNHLFILQCLLFIRLPALGSKVIWVTKEGYQLIDRVIDLLSLLRQKAEMNILLVRCCFELIMFFAPAIDHMPIPC